MMPPSRLALVLLAGIWAAATTVHAAALPTQPEIGADIYGGTVSEPGAFSFVTSIRYNGSLLCDGVLLNARTMLTNAHCTPSPEDDVDPSLFAIRVASLAWNDGGIVVGTSNYMQHPKYDPKTDHNDLALWRLSVPVNQSSGLSYATLPPQGFDPPAGAAVSVAGWGATNESPNSPPTYLHEITYPVASHATCEAYFNESHRYTTASMFCAGEKQGGKDACKGDSGSPAVDASSRVLWGIVSWGPHECGEPGHLDVYVRIGAFVDWIHQHMFH